MGKPSSRPHVAVGRRWTLLAAAALACTVVAGCTPKTEEQKAAARTAKEASGNELHLYNWNNYLAEDTAKRFEAHCKCKLVQDYYSDNEELLAKLAAGATGYDVLVPTANAVETLIAQGALREIDH